MAVAVMAGAARSELVTLTINGVGSGTLGASAFTDKIFQWTMTYNPAVYYASWGAADPIFLHPTSIITLGGVASPIGVTENHGLWVENTTSLYFAPIKMISDTNPGSNILLIRDPSSPSWNGRTSLTIDSFKGGAIDFGQFSNIQTNQGLLTMTGGTIGTPVPEPAAFFQMGALLGMSGIGCLKLLRRA